MAWDVEEVIAEVIATIRDAIPALTYVGEPDEAIPPDGPFCLVEHLGGPVDLGNLEQWRHGFRVTPGVQRNGMIRAERIAVRHLQLAVIVALRANVMLANDAAALTAEAEASGAQMMAYGEPPVYFVGAPITVGYETAEGVENEISD